MSHANGHGERDSSADEPGVQPAVGRPDLTDVETTDPDYLQEAILPVGAETHGGEDVGIWARGPGSAAFRGTLEQNVIYHVIVQATPALRGQLCQAGACNADHLPVELPSIDDSAPGKCPAAPAPRAPPEDRHTAVEAKSVHAGVVIG